jgi:hypothetical protein
VHKFLFINTPLEKVSKQNIQKMEDRRDPEADRMDGETALQGLSLPGQEGFFRTKRMSTIPARAITPLVRNARL